MNMKPFLRLMCLLAAISLVAGCTSTGVRRTSLDRERPISTDFDPDDLRSTAEAMVDSLLTSPRVVDLAAQDPRPVLSVERLENATQQHIDTKNVTDTVRTRLIRSGQFRFKDRTTSGLDVEIINEENREGLADPDQAVQPGQQITTELYLYGRIAEMKSSSRRTTDVYYKITLNLKDLKSGELVWADEQEIRKESKRPSLRW